MFLHSNFTFQLFSVGVEHQSILLLREDEFSDGGHDLISFIEPQIIEQDALAEVELSKFYDSEHLIQFVNRQSGF